MTNLFDVYSIFCICIGLVVCVYTFSSNKSFLSIVPFRSYKAWRLKSLLFCLGVIFLCCGFLTIKKNGNNQKVINNSKLPDIVFLIDFSASMRVVDHQEKSRINHVVDEIINKIDNLDADRFGLYLFSDREYQLIPLTRDLDFFKDQLISIQSNVSPDGGADLEQILLEINNKFESNKNILFVIASDFENINVTSKIVRRAAEDLPLIAWPVGSTAGGKIPIVGFGASSIQRYLRRNGKNVYSRVDLNSSNVFQKRINKENDFSMTVNKFLSDVKSNEKADPDWVSPGTQSVGNIFVFLGIILIGFSRFFVFFKNHYKFFLVFTLASNVFASDVEEVILSGAGSKKDFLIYAFERMQAEKLSDARNLYLEQSLKLNDLENINLGSLHFLNNEIEKGLEIYVKYLQENDPGSIEYNIVRKNLLFFLKNKSGGGSGKKNLEKRSEQENGSKGEGDGGSMSSSSNDNKSKDNNLSDEQIVKKLNADDLVNQGEYINKKIKAQRKIKKGEIRW